MSNVETTTTTDMADKNTILVLNNVERLVGLQNYNSWSFNMEMLLVKSGLWSVVKAKAKPEEVRKDELAKAEIALHVDSKVQRKIRKCESAYEMWNTLKDTYLDKSFLRQLNLREKLYTTTYSGCKGMDD